MQRALGTQPPVVTSVTSQIAAKPQKKDVIGPAEYEKKELPQMKPSVAQPATATNKPEGQKQASPTPSQKMSQEPQKTSGPNKSPDQTRQTEQETGGFFGFGGDKSQPDVAKPAESVSGKMLGFGSPIFSSASTLFTSAVQDQPKTTPPVSPKMSTAKEIKSPALQKKEQKKSEQHQQSKTPPLVQAKVDIVPSQHTKAALASQVTVKPGQSTCPLCKVKLNTGSKDPPNYNTCTECKNTVCNQCGFNPMPNVSEVSEIHSMFNAKEYFDVVCFLCYARYFNFIIQTL